MFSLIVLSVPVSFAAAGGITTPISYTNYAFPFAGLTCANGIVIPSGNIYANVTGIEVAVSTQHVTATGHGTFLFVTDNNVNYTGIATFSVAGNIRGSLTNPIVQETAHATITATGAGNGPFTFTVVGHFVTVNGTTKLLSISSPSCGTVLV